MRDSCSKLRFFQGPYFSYKDQRVWRLFDGDESLGASVTEKPKADHYLNMNGMLSPLLQKT